VNRPLNVEALYLSILAEPLSQLLKVLYRLARYPDVIADTIVTTQNLITNPWTFLLTPISPADSSPEPLRSRIVEAPDTGISTERVYVGRVSGFTLVILRMLLTSTLCPLPLANSLLTGTLSFYAGLALYEMHLHVVIIATAWFAELHSLPILHICAFFSRVSEP
jgi:hypothetical protein